MTYWEQQSKQPSFKDWLDFWEGCIICSCDHGCNGWIVKNSGKAYSIIKALQEGKSEDYLDGLAQKEDIDVGWQVWKDLRKRSKKMILEIPVKDGGKNEKSEN